ncbi:anti-lipopolysaccharide factor [Hyalella azteca]|uniref:Anti-lipopolysaccharide factor n=1 Tax=Hyalella azteca TaxID=294128 RepID=A0A8B7P8J9_HYAAZ|nr:anti-lipopolysaccharide factor [Hyalella azteca]XP_047739621.1 anti-lipopolysaccharide factor [Hyalella azteca]
MGKAGVLVLALVALTCTHECQAQDWSAVTNLLLNKILALWKEDSVQFMGSECHYRQKPKIYRWQLYYVGNFSCNKFFGIEGSGKGRSPVTAKRDSIIDFLNKAQTAGLLSKEEVDKWLQG